MRQHYDYILTGAGCAGLSLLRRMIKHPFLRDKKILLVDKDDKNTNDRTWCFWEQQPGLFEDVVCNRWDQVDFYSKHFSARFDLAPYRYKMIRGIDLYTTVLNEAKQHGNVDFYFGKIESVENNNDNGVVRSGGTTFSADYVFNSILFDGWKQIAAKDKNIYVLLQHFRGWHIKSIDPVFDDRVATFMDFRVSQERGTTFMYVMPVSKHEALVEYTLFTAEMLKGEEYDSELSNYISNCIGIKDYSVCHVESGAIPMTNYPFPNGDGKIINIGTAGGQTKGSSGYTFQFIQKHSDKIVHALVNAKNPLLAKAFFKKRFNLYDRIFLHVLCKKKMDGENLFAMLFKKNTPQQVLKFLDNETSFTEELKIMNTVPLSKFLPASVKEIFAN